MVALFLVGAGIALLWSGIRHEIVYRSLVDSFPPQFQDDPTSRYAFPVLALQPSTPLPLQAEYVKASLGGCVAVLCLSLCFFSIQEPIVGCVVLVVFFAGVFLAIKGWRTYQENCNRVVPGEDKEEP